MSPSSRIDFHWVKPLLVWWWSIQLYRFFAGLVDGDLLTAIAGQVRMASSASAFALWCSGGDKVITWGNLMCGILDRSWIQSLWEIDWHGGMTFLWVKDNYSNRKKVTKNLAK